MKIISITEIKKSIKFKLKFKHNTKSREETESLFVKIVTDSGTIAYGEGCPRSYVTGEDMKSCREFILKFTESIMQLSDLNDLYHFVNQNNKDISSNPSAWCALEVALLDLFAKENNLCVEKMLNLNFPSRNHTITAVIGIDRPFSFLKKLLKYRLFGMTDFKLKLTGDRDTDKRVLSWVKLSGVPMNHVRVDANNIWNDEAECIHALKSIDRYIWAIEEPLLKGDVKKFLKINQETGKKIILDESFLKIEDFDEIKKYPEIFLVNLRLSKMGGIIRSLTIIEEFKKYGFKFILGCHVGETSLLSRASLLIAENFNDHIYAMEGAYSSHLLAHDPASPEIKFGMKGKLRVVNLKLGTTGWGIHFES
jgi:L-alanine-DL-glutamate epimerase-like enolase superfamily enzyme